MPPDGRCAVADQFRRAAQLGSSPDVLSLKGKTVALVGPAAYVESAGLERFVQAADVVIRPNVKLTRSLDKLLLPQNTTDRVDVVYHSGVRYGDVLFGPGSSSERPSRQSAFCNATMQAYLRHGVRAVVLARSTGPRASSFWSTACPYHSMRLDAVQLDVLPSTKMRYFSTGMRALQHIVMRLKPARLGIFGFSFYSHGGNATRSLNGHAFPGYYQPIKGVPLERMGESRFHNFQHEMEHMASLLGKRSNIFVDTHMEQLLRRSGISISPSKVLRGARAREWLDAVLPAQQQLSNVRNGNSSFGGVTEVAPMSTAIARNVTGCTYVTLCTALEYCLTGVASLACSLRSSRHPLLVLTSEKLMVQMRKIVESWSGCHRRAIEVRAVVMQRGPTYKVPSMYANRAHAFGEMFAKLFIWSLVDFARVLFVDSDILVRRPEALDELFDLDLGNASLAAARDEGACARRTRGPPCCDDTSRAATLACDHKFQAGMLLVEPSTVVFQDMMNAWSTQRVRSYDGSDQGFQHSYFARHRIIRLPRPYNTLKRVERKQAADGGPDLASAAALHFVGEKPWNYRGAACHQVYPASQKLWREHVATCSKIACASAQAHSMFTPSTRGRRNHTSQRRLVTASMSAAERRADLTGCVVDMKEWRKP